MRALLIAVLLPAALSLSSCTPSRSDMGSHSTDESDSRAPRTKLNPHPTRAYRVSLILKDAPGPFQAVEGIADYTAKYRDEPARTCGYMAGGVGAFIALNESKPFELRKVAENAYEGIVYSDLMLDEDYDGEGVCHWSMIEVRARLRANDNLIDTRFAPFMRMTPSLTEKSETRYFWKGAYANPEFSNYTSFGQSDRARINRGDDELFTMTLSAKEIRP